MSLPTPPRRAALYIRVSTDEQARKGYSLPAQQEALEAYAKSHNYAVSSLYVDDGVSAHQPYTKRPALMRLLADVKAGSIDTILFIKLDRWFRSVKEYYKVQEILDAHRVTWAAILEDYETETSQGKMMVNIMLTVAQAESDRTSERIKFVNESKVAHGEIIGGLRPRGLKNENGRLVIDQAKVPLVRDVFRLYAEGGSVRSVLLAIRDRYGETIEYSCLTDMLRNPLYKGQYRDNPNYCEPIIPADEFERVQQLLSRRSVRQNPTGSVYLFAGIIRCAECGHAITACRTAQQGREYIYYRCRTAAVYNVCTHKKRIREDTLEQWLLLHALDELEGSRIEWEVQAAQHKPAPQTDRAALLRKLNKLKDLYINDLIDINQYREDYEHYKTELDKAAAAEPAPAPDFDRIRQWLTDCFSSKQYHQWTREEKRAFWREIIEKITIDSENNVEIYFR